MTNTTINEAASRGSEARSKATTAFGLLLATLVAALMVLAGASPAKAGTTFTVGSASDLGNGICDTSDTGGVCTLRDAISAANKTPNFGSPDVIRFDIPGDGPHTIRLTRGEPLPTITDPVVIDGYTQQGSSPNTLAKGTNAKLKVELDGTNAGDFVNGLTIEAPNCVVKGLVINGFDPGIGIRVNEGSAGTKIEGNFIGTDPSGTLAQGNFDGVSLFSKVNATTVGGTSPAARNLISGNDFEGVEIFGSRGNKVLGNLIGTKKDGIRALGNANHGVEIGSSSKNFVGNGTSKGANTIAFNASNGVRIVGGRRDPNESIGNRVLRNSIFSNKSLGIDLTDNGREEGQTTNDAGDKDVGPNTLQNFPVITSAKTSSTKTTIKAKLNSTPNKAFKIQFFSNPSGNEGKTFLGQKKVSTDSSGKVSFTKALPKVGVGKTITATATGPGGNTSEFSAPKKVVAS